MSGTDFVENKIFADQYTFFDRTLYGGVGHGVIVIPTHMIKIILTIIFPPIGILLHIVEDDLLGAFPYITWKTIHELCNFTNLNKLVYSFLLTSLFYFPGLIYTLSHLKSSSPANNIKGQIVCDQDNTNCVDMDTIPTPPSPPQKSKKSK